MSLTAEEQAELNEREAIERVERRAAEIDAATRAQQEQAQFVANYRQRMARAAGLKDRLIEQGLDESTATMIAGEVSNDFNSHHADALRLARPAVAYQIEAEAADDLNQAIFSVLPTDTRAAFFGTREKPISYDSAESAMKAVWEIARKGMLTEKEAKAQADLAVVQEYDTKWKPLLEQAGILSNSAGVVQGNVTGRVLTLQEIDTMPTAEWMSLPKQERDRLNAAAHAAAGR